MTMAIVCMVVTAATGVVMMVIVIVTAASGVVMMVIVIVTAATGVVVIVIVTATTGIVMMSFLTCHIYPSCNSYIFYLSRFNI